MATLHMDTCFVLGTGTTTPSHSYLEVFKIGNLLKIPLCTLVIQSVEHGCFPEQLHRLLTGFPKPVWLLVSSPHPGQQQPLRSTSDNISFLLMSFLRPAGVSGAPPRLPCACVRHVPCCCGRDFAQASACRVPPFPLTF